MKDREAFNYINKFYAEIVKEKKLINDDFDSFEHDSVVQKAIKMDVFQIGELVNKLSDKTKKLLDEKDVRGIINVRNFIGHAYIIVDNSIIWNTVNNDIPRLIISLEKVLK